MAWDWEEMGSDIQSCQCSRKAEQSFRNKNSNSAYHYLNDLGKYRNLLLDVFVCKTGLMPDLLLTCAVARIKLQVLIRGNHWLKQSKAGFRWQDRHRGSRKGCYPALNSLYGTSAMPWTKWGCKMNEQVLERKEGVGRIKEFETKRKEGI